ncbi:MAG TPA: tRNA (adenosine(37)-N6)-threonylcarbamoyltransferase complex transferase subunit TsaD [Edaphocola sp.]|nr:tRNA (adenosine(37)-N6)-threonylcarbamoyltransferase complex transferase subunit TsaD [Edaphocola sp.]
MKNKASLLLAIESSCDETSAAVFENEVLLSNVTATQKVHEAFGGVVPELASRAHIQNIIPVVSEALKKAGKEAADLTAIGFTQAPGLIGSLLVGVCFAKGMAQALDIPLIAVNHLQAHVLAHWIEAPRPAFPFLCLTVSGGHTQIVKVNDHLDMEIIGKTIDDAAGEAFDKIAKMLGLPYPGGPLVDKYARDGDPHAFTFPVPEMKGYDFSFSGIKTAVLYFLQKQKQADPGFIQDNLRDICASVQYTIVRALMIKLEKAAKDLDIREIGIGGGVSANSGLRDALVAYGRKHNWKTYLPAFQFCTDNAAMIGMTAYYKMLRGRFADLAVVPAAKVSWQ